MFSREESKKLREEFWISFGKSFPRKWTLYNTGIKNLSFKFYFDKKTAMVTLDLEHNDLEKQIDTWEKLSSLKSIITTDFLPDAIFTDAYILDNKKEISRIYVIKENVSIHNKNTWQETMVFLNENMQKFEAFFEDYSDIIKG
ncbi:MULTISPECIES: DUF4268 domain-containing protein [Cellulophaga]|uniref:DUF4268 domain-containing protein n=2 Tax=Cellulophaga TaxID=104264 RepID=F0RH33_CELLC|nr:MULTISPECIES: DUF4268 domain-containing protein [Cellulophaga]ADY28071.1 hypothetical protein Celly_0236 [Cellulophaga lytica DSM 7489]AIM59146.1 hypothetical protein IX49_00850 [Cellulophaga lytica]APU08954.1 hypothetical protein A5M85_01200 [Cellulophaga lytica]EWH14227.1 hypothetical protein KLA_06137 [Cellulophaga geojensis KL-A]MDO6855145.1 DUF4268 domain-containing protein [Cellulophaga lytica]